MIEKGDMSLKHFLLLFSLAAIYIPSQSPSQEQRTDDTNRREEDRPLVATKDSVYRISAGGVSSKDTLGERVTEFTYGVKIVHGNVTVTARRGFQYSGRRITHLVGDVTIVQEGLRMTGDEGEYHRFSDKAILKRNVRIKDRGWNVLCDRAIFFRTTEKAWLLGNVDATDSTTALLADSVFYDRESMTAEAFGRVSVSNAEEGFEVQGDHGFYFRETREGLVDRNPHLIVDQESPEPATVDSDTMWFFPDLRRASAYGRVKILKGTTVTQCDSAAVFDEESRAELYGNPLAKQENVSMKGKTMTLHYTDEEVDRIHIIKEAHIEEKQKDPLIVGRDSWIRGDSMTLYLHDNRVDSIRVVDNCESEYYPAAENRVESNFAKGDTMFFQFKRDTLVFVKITGNSNGIYRYLDLGENETCDSLRALTDTTLDYRPFGRDAEKVRYAAKHIEYYAREKDITLNEKAKVIYQNRTLLGNNIVYHSNLQLLDATGSPVLIEGGDKFYGVEMGYDLESGVGIVQEGSTQFMEGFYFGEHVAKVQDNVMKVWNSTYTTCDLREPHYHFASKEMKVYLKDKVVSGPIWLFIGDTPIAYLPFLANNIRKDRRSGILRPEFEFGITKSTGRFIRNFGYYWATNDYTDFEFIGAFSEDASFSLDVKNRYRLRYHFSGNVNYSFFRDLQTFRNKWTLSSNHSQTLGEKFKFTSNLSFVSSDDAPRSLSRVDDVENVINRQIRSTISMSKSWSSVSLSATGTRNQYLNITNPNSVRIQTTFPKLTLSIPSRNLYFGKETKRGEKSFLEKLLAGIRYSPGVSGSRQTQEKLFETKETITGSLSLNFSSPRKIGFINVSPSLSMSNNYTRTALDVKEHEETGSGTYEETTYWRSCRAVSSENVFSWRTGASMNTNLYGTFYPEIGPLIGIRHTVSPSASYSYQPPFGNRDSQQRLSVSLKNNIDLKVRGKKEGEDRKLSGVMIWTLSSSYNPKAPKRKGWSDISSSMNFSLFGRRVSVSQSFAPYDGKLLSTSITSGVSLHGTHGFGISGRTRERERNIIASDTTGSAPAPLRDAGEETGESVLPEGQGGGWNLSLNFHYTKVRDQDARATLNANGAFQLTKNWKFTYNASYDVDERKLMGQSYSIYRDLHCWEMSFARTKYGDEWEYHFRIQVKAHSDIYAESGKRGVRQGGFGRSLGF